MQVQLQYFYSKVSSQILRSGSFTQKGFFLKTATTKSIPAARWAKKTYRQHKTEQEKNFTYNPQTSAKYSSLQNEKTAITSTLF